MPVYNVEKFLEEAIESVLNQSLQDIQLILINDGSTDESLTICKRYDQQDNRILLLDQENSGVSIARNRGIEKAQGVFIYCMDSDDTIDVDFLSTTLKVAKTHQSDLVIVGEYFCNKNIDVPALPTWALFIRSSFLKINIDIRFPDNIQPCEDGLFSHQLLALTSQISLNPLGIYHYRKHENQNHRKVHVQYQKVLSQIPIWLEILKKFYAVKNISKSHAGHLALFLEHEPFEMRYLVFKLNKEQRKYLHSIIKEFYDQYVDPYITKSDKIKLGKPFLNFIKNKNHEKFDRFYAYYKMEKNFKLKLVNFIPFKSIRKKLRKNVESHYRVI